MKISIRVKTVSGGVISVVRVDKRNITKVVADELIKNVKLAVPDPVKVPQVKGKDRAQIIIKVDGKNVFNQKIKGIQAFLGTVGMVAGITKEIVTSVAS